ncbi:MAG: hypothetical protein GY842_14585, partial [bacterium]|nr:hypothetical protein [bacterium]
SMAASPRKVKKQHKIDVAHLKRLDPVPVGATSSGPGKTEQRTADGPSDDFMSMGEEKSLEKF